MHLGIAFISTDKFGQSGVEVVLYGSCGASSAFASASGFVSYGLGGAFASVSTRVAVLYGLGGAFASYGLGSSVVADSARS